MTKVNVCPKCRISTEQAICPNCERILIESLNRKPEKRPQVEEKHSYESTNYNGYFTIKKASDGSYICNCPSFLLQNGTIVSNGFAICKHIRDYLSHIDYSDTIEVPAPTEFQRLLLKTLGVSKADGLTNAQAYYLIRELMEVKGTNYAEITKFLKKGIKPKLFPLMMFGVEIEGAIRNKAELEGKIAEDGIEVCQTGYTGTSGNSSRWRISTDASVSSPAGYESVELVSPKLFGFREIGLKQLKKILEIWNQVGAEHPASAGTHIHVNGYGLDNSEFLKKLALVWAKIETNFVWYLVSPSRRKNNYCCRLNEDYFVTLANSGHRHLSRYYSLNLAAYNRHNTIEFRIFNSSTDYEKIFSWIVLVLCLVEAVRNGFDAKDIPDEFKLFLDRIIGRDGELSYVLWKAKKYLLERYSYWKKDAEQHPEHVPNVTPLPDNIEDIVELNRLRRKLNLVNDFISYAGSMWSRNGGWGIYGNLFSNAFNEIERVVSIRTGKVAEMSEIAEVVSEEQQRIFTLHGRTIKVELTDGKWIPKCDCSRGIAGSNCYHRAFVCRYILLNEAKRIKEETETEIERLIGSETTNVANAAA